MMHDPVFDAVKRLEPETVGPSPAARERQRHALMAALEPPLPRTAGRQARRRPRFGWAGLTVTVVLALGGGGIAAAAGLAGGPPPTPRQAATIYAHGYPDHGARRTPGTRPPLNAELVLCDYRGAVGLPTADRLLPVEEGFASSGPLTAPLDTALLVRGCEKVATTGDVVPATTPGTVCVTGHPSVVTDTPAGWPIVVFGTATCQGSGDLPAPTSLLAQVNQRRNIEASIDAVPESCPTQAEAVSWVRAQLKALDVQMQLDSWSGGPGGRCYVPSVQWWSPPTRAPVVEVTASQQLGNPPGASNTSRQTLPPASTDPTTAP
jgi:hypothetical protein